MQALRHCVGVRSAVTRCGLVGLRIQAQGLHDGWLRRVCVSGLLGVQAARVRYGSSIQAVCQYERKDQREAAAIVDAVYALRGPVLAMYTLV